MPRNWVTAVFEVFPVLYRESLVYAEKKSFNHLVFSWGAVPVPEALLAQKLGTAAYFFFFFFHRPLYSLVANYKIKVGFFCPLHW